MNVEDRCCFRDGLGGGGGGGGFAPYMYINTHTHIFYCSIKQWRRGRRAKRVRVREVELGRKSCTVHEGLAVLHQ